MRQERLHIMNNSLYHEYMKRYKTQQEAALRACINISAYNSSLLDKEKKMWNDIITNSMAAS